MSQDDRPATPVAPPSGPPPQQIIVQQPPSAFGRYGKWLLLALVIAVMTTIGVYQNYRRYFSEAEAPRERYHSLSRTATKKIAVIDISGPILEGEDSFAKRQIDRVRRDDNVVGVVVRLNSPGGTVTGSHYLYHHLRELAERRELPLVVSMGSIAASGGYYIAMCVGDRPDAIFAEPTTWTGSIGVIIPRFDLSGALEALRIEEQSIASSPLKRMGAPTRPMTDQEQEILQSLVNESFAGFKQVLLSGRPKLRDDAAAVETVTSGQIFTATQALQHGMVDRIGFVEDAITRVIELAGETEDTVRVVQYRKRPTLVDSLVGSEARTALGGGVDLGGLIDLSVPRAYYLWSWLPAAISNAR
jgi:protease IV